MERYRGGDKRLREVSNFPGKFEGVSEMLYALIDSSSKYNFNKISSEEILGEVRVVTPKFELKNTEKMTKKVLKKLDEYKVDNVILSQTLLENKEFCKAMEEAQKRIITGHRIEKVMLLKFVTEIARYTRFPKEKMHVLLFMNEYSLENIDLIERISQEVKEMHIISRNYTKYEKTKAKLFEQYGFVINLYPPEVKDDFRRVNLVINQDFKEEDLRKVDISKNAIVLSLNEKIRKIRNGFNGIIINDIDLVGDFESTKKYRDLALCEAKIYKPLRKLKDNERLLNSEKCIINGYIGLKGKITEEEFEKIGRTFA